MFCSNRNKDNHISCETVKRVFTDIPLMIQEIYIIKHGDRRQDHDHICSAAKLVPTFLKLMCRSIHRDPPTAIRLC